MCQFAEVAEGFLIFAESLEVVARELSWEIEQSDVRSLCVTHDKALFLEDICECVLGDTKVSLYALALKCESDKVRSDLVGLHVCGSEIY